MTTFKRSTPHEDRGRSNGHTLYHDLEVWAGTEDRLFSTTTCVEYEYFAIIPAIVSEDGLTMEICGQGDEVETEIFSCQTGKRLSRNITAPGA